MDPTPPVAELMADIQHTTPPPAKHPVRTTLLIIGVFFAIALVLGGSSYAYTRFYVGKVYPGVQIGNLNVGSLTVDQVKNSIETANNRYAKEGILVNATDTAGEQHRLIFTTIQDGDVPLELFELDSDAAARLALGYGRNGSWFSQLWKPLASRFLNPVVITAPVVVNQPAVHAELTSLLSEYEDTPNNATVRFAPSSLEPKLVPEKVGYTFNHTSAAQAIQSAIEHLSFTPVSIAVEKFTPVIVQSDVEKILPTLSHIFDYGDLTINYKDPKTNAEQTWVLEPRRLAQWLEVRRDKDNTVVFALQENAVKEYIRINVQPVVDVPAAEAKFVMADGKVKEFQASRTGLALNIEKTYNDIDAAFRARNSAPTDVIRTISVSVDIAEPTIKNASGEEFGITDIIGVGVSSFRGSHAARIKNVARAVELLNGVLIKPGETFSTTKYVGPITLENGYYPELVIKGSDASSKEVGGGMCQIGTTLFRMAMNSGMPIVERRNHSLVVNYYADPVNGNPGTDATIYDPLIDFKFLNDTGNYVLLQTEMDMKTLQLHFTLWGKKDGRTGSYTHPLVSKWIPTGEPVNIAVTDGSVKPGEQRCQPAYRGAMASFTYTRTTSSSPEKIEEVFTSYYRPLPKICRIGVEPGSPCLADNSCFATPAASSTVQ